MNSLGKSVAGHGWTLSCPDYPCDTTEFPMCENFLRVASFVGNEMERRKVERMDSHDMP